MARKQREQPAADIRLQQPDRSGPTEQTLLQLAEERGLFKEAEKKQKKNKLSTQPAIVKVGRNSASEVDGDEEFLSPTAEHVVEILLYTVSLTVLHVTLDVMVQHQYSVDRVVWPRIGKRAGQAFVVFALLVYQFHPHSAKPSFLPGLSVRFQNIARQAIFFATSLLTGCYFISISNTSGYLAVMKQAPPLGCLWIWSVIELDLAWALLSLAGAGLYIWQKGYKIF